MAEGLLSRYMGTKEASEKWGIPQQTISLLWGYPQNTISRWCQQGKIPGAQQTAPCSPWLIPRDAVCPVEKYRK